MHDRAQASASHQSQQLPFLTGCGTHPLAAQIVRAVVVRDRITSCRVSRLRRLFGLDVRAADVANRTTDLCRVHGDRSPSCQGT